MSKRGASSGSAIGRKQIGKGLPVSVSEDRFHKAVQTMGSGKVFERVKQLQDKIWNYERFHPQTGHSKQYGSPVHHDAVNEFNKIVKQYTASWKGK